MSAVLAPLVGRSVKRRRIRGYHKRWVYTRHLGHCFMCGEFIAFRKATVDHWVPLVHGGKHSRSNFVLACPRCNNEKANLVPAEADSAAVGRELSEIRSRYKR